MAILRLEKKYDLNLKEKIQYISAALSIQSDELNLIFSWPSLINAEEFRRNRGIYSYEFMRSPPTAGMDMCEFKFLFEKKAAGKKIIYFSLGTIAPGIKNADLLDFIIHLYDCLIKDFGENSNAVDEYEVILSFGSKESYMSSLRDIPPNFHLSPYLPQEALLQSGCIDAFITHGGGNGVNESIDHSVPMIVIPLMHDQHLCGENVSKLGIGINFPYLNNAKPYSRESVHRGVLKNAVTNILSQPEYNQYLEAVRSVKPLPFYNRA